MKYVIRNKGIENIEGAITANSGIPAKEFLESRTYAFYKTEEFKEILSCHETVAVCGDYDVDGITSTYIMKRLLEALGKTVYTRLPKRCTEGFGLSTNAIQDCLANGCSLIVTVDNGISAKEAVEYAKNAGLEVIVTDHHLPDDALPAADLIIDPMAVEGADFNGYCGAGIAYKIASELLTDNDLLSEMKVVAAVGTVADSVPMVRDNHQIVKEGLELMRGGKVPEGINSVILEMGVDMEHITEDDIAFKLAPALNAPGRILDDGAKIGFDALSGDKTAAKQCKELNEKRKDLVSDAVDRINATIAQTIEEEGALPNPLIVSEILHEGIIGIVAGQLAEKYQVPSFVVTPANEGLKGSGRAPKGYHLKEMLDKAADLLVHYGGHAAAAGLTIKEDKFDEFKSVMAQQAKKNPVQETDDAIYYDIEVKETDLPKICEDLQKYAPFGEGNPCPVVYVKEFTLVPDKEGYLAKEIGTSQKMIRFSGVDKMSAVSFTDAARYNELGRPDVLSVVGTVKYNHWNGWSFVQVLLNSFDCAPEECLSLATLVHRKLKAMRTEAGHPEETSEAV